jgi:hypothetical protein
MVELNTKRRIKAKLWGILLVGLVFFLSSCMTLVSGHPSFVKAEHTGAVALFDFYQPRALRGRVQIEVFDPKMQDLVYATQIGSSRSGTVYLFIDRRYLEKNLEIRIRRVDKENLQEPTHLITKSFRIGTISFDSRRIVIRTNGEFALESYLQTREEFDVIVERRLERLLVRDPDYQYFSRISSWTGIPNASGSIPTTIASSSSTGRPDSAMFSEIMLPTVVREDRYFEYLETIADLELRDRLSSFYKIIGTTAVLKVNPTSISDEMLRAIAIARWDSGINKELILRQLPLIIEQNTYDHMNLVDKSPEQQRVFNRYQPIELSTRTIYAYRGNILPYKSLMEHNMSVSEKALLADLFLLLPEEYLNQNVLDFSMKPLIIDISFAITIDGKPVRSDRWDVQWYERILAKVDEKGIPRDEFFSYFTPFEYSFTDETGVIYRLNRNMYRLTAEDRRILEVYPD